MKIIFYYSSISNGGAERVISTLANNFAKRGDEVSILTYDDGKSGYFLSEKVTVIPLNIMSESKNLIEAIGGIIKEVNVLRRYTKQLCPDVILGFSNRMAVTAKWATLGLHTKVVGSERSNPYVARTSWKEQLFVKQSGILDGFVFQTEGAKGFYPKHIQKKSIVIPNGVFITSENNRKTFSEREPYSLLATGRIIPSKRYDIMIDAMVNVVKFFPKAKLDIYGIGENYKEIWNYIQSYGMQDRIILHGRVLNVQDYLASHQVFLLTSENEGMPNGLIEAMAMGCVCISSDCDFGPSELITNGVDGMLYPVGDVKRLSEQIIQVFSNTEKSSDMARRATEINTRLAFPLIADQFHDYLLTK